MYSKDRSGEEIYFFVKGDHSADTGYEVRGTDSGWPGYRVDRMDSRQMTRFLGDFLRVKN